MAVSRAVVWVHGAGTVRSLRWGFSQRRGCGTALLRPRHRSPLCHELTTGFFLFAVTRFLAVCLLLCAGRATGVRRTMSVASCFRPALSTLSSPFVPLDHRSRFPRYAQHHAIWRASAASKPKRRTYARACAAAACACGVDSPAAHLRPHMCEVRRRRATT